VPFLYFGIQDNFISIHGTSNEVNMILSMFGVGGGRALL